MKSSSNPSLIFCVSLIVVLYFFYTVIGFVQFSLGSAEHDYDRCDTECSKLRCDGWLVFDESCFYMRIRRTFVAARFIFCVVFTGRVIAHKDNKRMMKNEQTNKPRNVSENNNNHLIFMVHFPSNVAPRPHWTAEEGLRQKIQKGKVKKLRK